MILLVVVALIVCVNAVVLEEPDCTKCEFSIGGIGYLPGPDCRTFYQCCWLENGYTEHVKLCCPWGTVWDQDIKNCDYGHCDIGYDNCPGNGTNDGPCPYWADDKNQAWYWVHHTWTHMMCPAGTVYRHEICGCDYGYGYRCYKDPLLHFPFADDFNDIQCPKAVGIPHGDAHIPKWQGYMWLDGDGDYMTFSFLNNWFAGNSPDHFLLSVWIKQEPEAFGPMEGIFSNGNCNEDPSILLDVYNGSAGGGIITDQRIADFPNYEAARDYAPPGIWCNIAIRYSVPDMKVSYFLNGHLVDMKDGIKGDITNTMSDSSVGLAYLHCIPFFFTGCIDDLMVFTRYVSDWEVYACIWANGRTEGHSKKMYECPDHKPTTKSPWPSRR